MKLIATVLATAMIATPAFAQMSNGMASDAMQSGSMKLSKADMATMKKCQAMSHDAMAKSKKCATFMKSHPDAMMSSDGMSSHM